MTGGLCSPNFYPMIPFDTILFFVAFIILMFCTSRAFFLEGYGILMACTKTTPVEIVIDGVVKIIFGVFFFWGFLLAIFFVFEMNTFVHLQKHLN